MRAATAILIACGVVATSLLLGRTHPFGDAGLFAPLTDRSTLFVHSAMPPAARAILQEKCADCHSTTSQSPQYGRFAPASWLMERDILKARSAMNFSQWDNYSAEKQETFKTKVLLETRAHRMPPWQYRVLHADSRLNDRDIEVLAHWAHDDTRTDESAAAAPEQGDGKRGESLFQRRCAGCHALNDDREGPRLKGVFGRTSGSVQRFDYSPALKQAHVVWNERTLERWLADPDSVVPGNNMDFAVRDPQERRDVIRFLQQVSGR